MTADELPLSRLRVLRVRDESVLLDSDLAALYGVETKVFNQAIKRNAHRFPRDFAFQLSQEEWAALRSQIVTLTATGPGQHRKYLPWVFTEHGAIMAATLLNSDRAIAMSTYVVRAFVRLRRELLTNATLEARLSKIEKELLSHDAALRTLFSKIKPLLVPPPEPPAKEMGFHTLIKTRKQ
ncbi:MAG: ORF6N domain-containing protein [Opitutus sp.]